MNATTNSTSNISSVAYGYCTASLYPKKLFSDAFAWGIIGLYCIILLFGLLGNMLTVIVVFIHKSMRRSIHCYMLNLAIADIIILLLFTPTQSILIYNHLEWTMGKDACSIIIVAVPTCLSGSIATLIAISLDRYSGVRDPFTWRIKSRRNSKLTIPVIWMLSVSSAIPYFLYGGLRQSPAEGCRCIWPNSSFKTTYMTAMMAIQFIFPFILIAGVYMHIVWIISRGRASINHLHKRMVKMVILLLLTYLVCDGMQYVDFFYELFIENSPRTTVPYMYTISNLLLTVQAAINPMIYSSTRDDFNLAFKSLMMHCRLKMTTFLVEERYDVTSFRSETDTERWFDIGTGRRGSGSVRKISDVMAKKMNFVEPPRKKSSIFMTIRKPSTHSVRKKSSIRPIPPIEADSDDSIGSCSDYEEGEEPTLRSYRLGTLEFLELEEFHEKMRDTIRKESAIRKISRTIMKHISNSVFYPDDCISESKRNSRCLDAETAPRSHSDKSDTDEETRYSMTSKSVDSVSSGYSTPNIDHLNGCSEEKSPLRNGSIFQLDKDQNYVLEEDSFSVGGVDTIINTAYNKRQSKMLTFHDSIDLNEDEAKIHLNDGVQDISDLKGSIDTINNYNGCPRKYSQENHGIISSRKRRSRKFAIVEHGKRGSKRKRSNTTPNKSQLFNSEPARRKSINNENLSKYRRPSKSLDNISTIQKQSENRFSSFSDYNPKCSSKSSLATTSSNWSVPGKGVLKTSDPDGTSRSRKTSKSIRWEDTALSDSGETALSHAEPHTGILSKQKVDDPETHANFIMNGITNGLDTVSVKSKKRTSSYSESVDSPSHPIQVDEKQNSIEFHLFIDAQESQV